MDLQDLCSESMTSNENFSFSGGLWNEFLRNFIEESNSSNPWFQVGT